MTPSPRTLEALDRTLHLIQLDFYPDLDPVSIAQALGETHVRIAATGKVIRSRNGQTAIVTAAILCMQMGMSVALDFPEARIIGGQPPLRGEGVRESLRELGSDLVLPPTIGAEGTFTISFGRDIHGEGVGVAGNDWAFTLKPSSNDCGDFTGTLPFGAGLSATAAAAEAFRGTMRHLGTTSGVAPSAEHPVRRPLAINLGIEPFTTRSLDAGSVDFVSAGALTNAAMYYLLRIPGFTMQARVFDGDTGALSNLNRYLMLRGQLLGLPKVASLASYASESITIEPIDIRLGSATEERLGRFADRVLVGVDDIPTRWWVQERAPKWVGVAATSHLETLVSEHVPGSPCAGCLHPHDAPDAAAEIPTISFVSTMAGLLLAHRLARAVAHGSRPSHTVAYPFNLAGERPLWTLPLAAHPQCPVGCVRSREAL